MKILKRIVIAIAILAAAFFIIGFFLPTDYTVQRSILINADKASIHKYVGDLTNWESWSPWKENDPSVVITMGEKTRGVGASQSWHSDHGDGSLKFLSSSVDEGIKYDLFFDQGTYQSVSAMLYQQQDDGVLVTWSMRGDMAAIPVIGSYFALMMDGMTGAMFERGLQKLKFQVEKESPPGTGTRN